MKLYDIATTGSSIFADVNIEAAINSLSEQHNIHLADIQKEAILKLKKLKVMVVTGGPGTGKTTLINSIIKILRCLRIKLVEFKSN